MNSDRQFESIRRADAASITRATKHAADVVDAVLKAAMSKNPNPKYQGDWTGCCVACGEKWQQKVFDDFRFQGVACPKCGNVKNLFYEPQTEPNHAHRE